MNYKKTKQHIVDSTFNRLMDRLKNTTCAIITAYRCEDAEGNKMPKEENIRRNRKLRAIFNERKMGVYQLVGHWQEAPNNMNYEEAKEKHLLTDVIERSYVVPKPESMSDDEFKSLIMDCMTIDGLTQDSIVYHDAEGFSLIFNNGEEDFLGKNVDLNKIAQAYSQSVLKIDTPFIFDSVRQPNGAQDAMGMKHQGLLWLDGWC